MQNISVYPSFNKAYHKETLSKALAHTYPYHRYSQEEINALNSINLVEFCIYISEKAVSYQADRLVVRKYPHVVIYPEGFYDTKQRKRVNAINGLKEYFGFDFLQACYMLQRYYDGDAILNMDSYVKKYYPLAYNSSLSFDFNLNYMLKYNLLDYKNNNSLKMVYSVLHNRMYIDRDVISRFLHTKKLIVNNKFDLCFLEYENENIITVTKKLQYKKHMAIEVETVKRNTTFTWIDKEKCSYYNVYVFEDVYQIMSYLTLINKALVPPLEPNSVMLSLNGTSFYALKSYLHENQKVKAVYACLSNTADSIKSIKDIPFDADKVINMQTHLKDYTAKYEFVKTWNDMLKSNNKNTKE